jgi:lysophospholipase L1-like esterase
MQAPKSLPQIRIANLDSFASPLLARPAADAARNPPAPLDVLPNAIAAYATRRLRTGYQGPGVTVRRNDGLQMRIGFTREGGLDLIALDHFLEGGVGRVALWHDQSGHGADAVQPDGAHQPAILPSNMIGNARSIIFDSTFYSAENRAVWMELPPAVAAIGTANAALLLARWASSVAPCCPLQWNSHDGASFNLLMDGTINIGLRHSGIATILQPPPLTPLVCGWSCSAWETRMFAGPRSLSFAPSVPGALSGGTLGANSAHDVAGRIEMSCMLLYDRAITQPEERSVTASVRQLFALPPPPLGTVLFVGDSLTEMSLCTALQSFPRRTEALLAVPANCFNGGAWGQTIEYLTGTFAEWYAPLSAPGRVPNICFILAGSNNFAFEDQDAGAIWQALRGLLAAARAAGFQVIIATLLPRLLSAERMRRRHDVNDLIRAHWRHEADAICDFAADEILGGDGAANDRALYPDACHASDAAAAIMARLAADSIHRLLTNPIKHTPTAAG